ncbi:MAG: SDR family oxidoreductase [Desulfobacteraceae bacterium]|nr:SDR family oxidoreductase [Desulfobacteraceae bacterium]
MENLWFGLEDKVFVVTGGSRGIGLETARALLGQKAKVVICARKQEGLEKAQNELRGGDSLLAVQAHVAKQEEVERLFDTAVEKFGRVDVLVNNMGMNLPTGELVDTEAGMWQKILDSNLTGTYLCSRKAGRIMREQKYGSIVSVTSTAAHRASPGMNIYGIAKAGIEMMTKNLASELAPHNIRVNAVAPTMVRTDFSKPFWSNQEIYDMVVKNIPMGRIAEPEDVVKPVLFLASEGASFITGQTIVVDGGSSVV